MKISGISAALFALASVAAQAQDVITTAGTDWRGFFVGANIGGAWNHTCQSWTPGPTITGNPVLASAFYNRNCPNNGNFIGGIDLGYNFQHDQWVWGLKADYDAVNLNLSQRRADAVKDYLVSKGVSPSNLTAKGYGKAKPIVSNDTAEGRAQNRRVAFELTNVPAHVNVVTKDASAASTEAAEQGQQPKTKKEDHDH